ncbi:MAG: NAD(P)H-dependent oxidoreductase subunit E [Clostridiales bacterium]|nr:NAD(P)H-dependent oxidoreductase subunit E [Clostridiales bacterium]
MNVGHTTEDGKFTLRACRCLGACGLAPVLNVNGKVFGRLTVDDVQKIINQFE